MKVYRAVYALLPLGIAASPLWFNSTAARSPLLNSTTISLQSDTYKPNIHWNASCGRAWDKLRVQGFEEAETLSKALLEWQPGGAYQNVMDIYFGSNSMDYADELSDIIKRHNNILTSTSANVELEIEMTCEGETCLMPSSLYTAYTRMPTKRADGSWYSYMSFCDHFFSNPTLGETLGYARPNEYPTSRGWTIMHEFFHLPGIIAGEDGETAGDGDSGIYRSVEVRELADSEGTESTMHIADAYCCAAWAIYKMKSLKLTDVPLLNI